MSRPRRDTPPVVLTYAPWTFVGRGAITDVVTGLTPRFAQPVMSEIYGARFRVPMPPHVRAHPALGPGFRHLPWRLVKDRAQRSLNAEFRKALDAAEPDNTVAYFYPASPPEIDLVRHSVRRGILTVRVMINTACATSGPILDRAYAALSLPPTHPVTRERIAAEIEELRLYDFILSPDDPVDKSLLDIGIPEERIVKITTGWDSEFFGQTEYASAPANGGRPQVLFVGEVGIRKGIPQLLKAWEAAKVDADLILAGPVTPEVSQLVEQAVRNGNVSAVGFTKDVRALFRKADIFVFPTLEEGGPRVTFEAAATGLPIITTPMGVSRMVEDGVHGLVVEPGSVSELADAIRLLVNRPDLRREYGDNARKTAADFTYHKVAERRGAVLLELLASRQSGTAASTNGITAT